VRLHTSSVYVNAASARLEAASRSGEGSLEIREGKRWVTGAALLADARRRGAELPLIFAHYAELTYWALARAIEVDDAGTTYTFSHLTPVAGFRRSDLTVRSSRSRLPDNFIRSYAIVETPAFLAPARVTSPSDEVVLEETLAAVRPRGTTSQGWQGSAERRTAIELHAMRRAQAHYSKKWAIVTDVSRTHSYDLECQDGARRLMVEVKGTTSAGHGILLTRNEVRVAQENPTTMALFVVYNIRIDADGVPEGGDVVRYEPWDIGEHELEPVAYQCHLRRDRVR
jgi:hypothetical protein